jgi:hypothetical protein
MVEIRAEGEVVGDSAFEGLHRRLVARIPGWNHSVSGILNAWHRRKLVHKVYRAEARIAREKPPCWSKAPDPQYNGNLLNLDRNPAEQLGLTWGVELKTPDLEEWMEDIHGGSSSSKTQTSKNGWTTSIEARASLDADIANYRLKHSSSRLLVPIEESARYQHQVARIDGFTIVSRKDSGQLPLSKWSVEITLKATKYSTSRDNRWRKLRLDLQTRVESMPSNLRRDDS